MSLNVHNTTLQTLFSIYVPLLLGVVLIPDCISFITMFSANRPPAQLLSDVIPQD